METNQNNAREEFLRKYKTNLKEINNNNKILKLNNYLRPEDRIPKEEMYKAIEEMTKSLEREKRKKRENERKRRIRKSKMSRRAKFIGNVKKTAIVLGAIGIVIAGGNTIKNTYDTYQQQNAPITLEQALDNGENLDSLGIDNNILLEMQDIQEMLEKDDLTNEEIIKLAPRISGLQFDTAKSKLANTLGVTENEIRLYTTPIEEGQTRETIKTSNDMYTNKDIFTYENTMPSELSNYIKEISEMQKIMEEMKKGNINRKEILEKYEKMVNNTSQLAASKMNVDDRKNIKVEYTKVVDLNKTSNQTEIASADQVKDNEEER